MRATIIKDIFEQLYSDLWKIRDTSTDLSERVEHSIAVIQKALAELKDHILTYPFKSTLEEICFFKYIKPCILQELIVYVGIGEYSEITSILIENGLLQDYLYCELRKIEVFYDRNKDFCKYLALDEKRFDAQFFVRRPGNPFSSFGLPIELDATAFYGDPDFSTSHDYRAAKFYAYVVLEKVVRQQLALIEKIEHFAGQVDERKAICQNEELQHLLTSIKTDSREESDNEDNNDDPPIILKRVIEKLIDMIEVENGEKASPSAKIDQ